MLVLLLIGYQIMSREDENRENTGHLMRTSVSLFGRRVHTFFTYLTYYS